MIDERESELFLKELLGDGLSSNWAHVWHSGDRHSDWVQDVPAALASVDSSGRSDVYFGTGLLAKAGGKYERVTIDGVVGMLGFLSDVDVLDPSVHKQLNLPPDEVSALGLIDELGIESTLLVDSGHGLQAWWLFNEPRLFADSADRNTIVKLSANWQAHISGIAYQHGWELDNVGDPARVLRVPGTWNAKNPNEIVPVTLLRSSGIRYAPEMFEELCRGDSFTRRKQTHFDDSGITNEQRFLTAENPCPNCGGYGQLPKGIGIRCWGFRDGDYVYCTRPEYANGVKPVMTRLGSVIYKHKIPVMREIVSQPMSEVVPKRLTWALGGYIPLGELTLSVAPGGAGKTRVNFDLMVRFAAGLPMPGELRCDFEGPVAVGIVTSENDAEYTMQPELEAAALGLGLNEFQVKACLANIHEIKGTKIVRPDGTEITEMLAFPNDLEPTRRWVEKMRVKVLFIDPLISFTSTEVSAIDAMDVRHLLDPLVKLAKSESMSIVAVIHFNKRTDGDLVAKVSGSRQYVDCARSVFAVLVERMDENFRIQRWMVSAKHNLAPTPYAVPFYIVSVPHPTFSAEGDETPILEWEPGSMRIIEADELNYELQLADDDKPHTVTHALMGLIKRLEALWADGSENLMSSHLSAWQDELDVSNVTWGKAKKELGVKTVAHVKGGPWSMPLKDLEMFRGRTR